MKSRGCRIDDRTEALYLQQLEHGLQCMRAVYRTMAQWAAVLGAAWAGMLTLGVQARSAAMVGAAGVAALILAYNLNAAGKAAQAVLGVIQRLEHDLGIPESRSVSAAFVAGFRGADFLSELKRLSGSGADDVSTGLTHLPAYSIFHPTRSKTVLIIVIVGVTQTAVAVLLVLLGYMPV